MVGYVEFWCSQVCVGGVWAAAGRVIKGEGWCGAIRQPSGGLEGIRQS